MRPKLDPEIAEKQNQYKNHDQRTFHQVSADGTDGVVHHFGTVEERMITTPSGKVFWIWAMRGLDVANHFVAVRAFEHHHDRAGDFAFSVVRHRAISGSAPEADFRHIADYTHVRRAGF